MNTLNAKPLSKAALVDLQKHFVLAFQQDLREFDWNSLSPALTRKMHALLPPARDAEPTRLSLIPEHYYVGDSQKRPVNASWTYTRAEALSQMEYEMKKDDRDLYVWSISEAIDASVDVA